jgi:hypothetical protein
MEDLRDLKDLTIHNVQPFGDIFFALRASRFVVLECEVQGVGFRTTTRLGSPAIDIGLWDLGFRLWSTIGVGRWDLWSGVV